MSIAMMMLMVSVAGTPEAGALAPDFRARDTAGNQYHLESLVKSGPVVVAFFPKAFTSG